MSPFVTFDACVRRGRSPPDPKAPLSFELSFVCELLLDLRLRNKNGFFSFPTAFDGDVEIAAVEPLSVLSEVADLMEEAFETAASEA